MFAFPFGFRRRSVSFSDSIFVRIHPGITAGNMSSWRFGSDHFPFQMGDGCRFQPLIFRGDFQLVDSKIQPIWRLFCPKSIWILFPRFDQGNPIPSWGVSTTNLLDIPSFWVAGWWTCCFNLEVWVSFFLLNQYQVAPLQKVKENTDSLKAKAFLNQ